MSATKSSSWRQARSNVDVTTTTTTATTTATTFWNSTEFTNLTEQLTNLKETPYYDLGPRRDSLGIIVPVTIIYSLIFISGVVGNISTCIVIKKNRSMHTATNYYLFSLAISDFMLLLSGVPQEIYFIWSKYPYVFGEYFCIGRGLLAETSANATVLTITAFTVERYMAICHPFLGQAMSKLSRAIRIIILIWVLSVLAAIPQVAQFGIYNFSGIEKCVVVRVIIEHSFQLSTYIFFLAPMSIIMVLYLLIGVHLYRAHLFGAGASAGVAAGYMENGIGRGAGTGAGNGSGISIWKRHNSQQQRQKSGMKSVQSDAFLYRYSGGSAAGSGGSATQLSAVRGRINHYGTRRVLKMLVAVVICFFLCWAPFHAQRLWAVYATEMISGDELTTTTNRQHATIYAIMTYSSGVLYYLSTCINPLLYNLMSHKFREAFKVVLFGKKSKSLNSRHTLESRRLRRTTTLTSSTQRETSETELPAKQSLLQTTLNERLIPTPATATVKPLGL